MKCYTIYCKGKALINEIIIYYIPKPTFHSYQLKMGQLGLVNYFVVSICSQSNNFFMAIEIFCDTCFAHCIYERNLFTKAFIILVFLRIMLSNADIILQNLIFIPK